MPRRLVSQVDAGERLAVPTIVWAARWKTLSDLVLAQRALHDAGADQVAGDDVDLCLEALEHERGARRRVSPQHRDLDAVAHEGADQRGAQQPVGPRHEGGAHQAHTFHGASPRDQMSLSRTASL